MKSPPVQVTHYAAIAAAVADRLGATRAGTDPFSHWEEDVIVASAGVGEAVAEQILARIPAGVAGLQLQTLEVFARRVLNEQGEYPRVASELERRMAMRAAAKAVRDPLTETRGAAAMLERSYRDLRDSGITLEELARRLQASRRGLRNPEHTRLLLRIWQEYERLTGLLQTIDPADLLARAAALIRNGAPLPPQILCGYYDVTGAQWEVIAALREVEKLAAVFIPTSHPFAQPLIQRLGGGALPVTPPPLPRYTVTEHRTREEEIRHVTQAVAALLSDGVPAQRIGLTARVLDPYDLELLRRFGAELGLHCGAPSQTLIGHRFGRCLALLLRLRERDFARADVLEIARSGLRLQTRIDVDQADLETRQAGIAGGNRATLLGLAEHSFAVRDYLTLIDELEELTATIDSAWFANLANRFRLESESDLAAVEAIQGLGELVARTSRWKRPLDVPSILDALEQIAIPPAPPAGTTIWTGDVMRLRGRTFDHLFAMRLQDGILPQRRSEDPLLPDADREILGLRRIGDGRQEEHLLWSLICAAGKGALHCSYASSDGLGKPLRPSQYLKALAMEIEPSQKAAILENFSRFSSSRRLSLAVGEWSDSSPMAHDMRALQLLARAGSSSPFDGFIDHPLVLARAAAALEGVSPTHLEDFGECPQKFLMKHILGVREVDDPERDVQINHREKGIVDHVILERFYRELSAAEIEESARQLPLLPAAVTDRLERIVDEEFDRLERRSPPHNPSMRAMERRATKRVLRHFISGDLAELIALGLTPTRFEFRFGTKHRRRAPDHPEAFVVETEGISLRVEGTIDRIDRGPQMLRIVDYKSGKAKRHEHLAEKIDRGVRLQLPLYAMAAATIFGVEPEQVGGAIKPLVRDETPPERFAFFLGAKRQRLLDTLNLFVRAIRDGRFPAFPNERDEDFNACKYCPVNHSCRTKHDAEQRRAALRFEVPRRLLEELYP